MFQNYLTVALRNFSRHKLYSFINVVGLAVGLAAVILIGLYVQQEVTFDAWLPHHERLYRIDITLTTPGQPSQNFGAVSAPLGPAIVAEIPGVQEQTRIVPQDATVTVGHQQYAEWFNAVDANFFTIIRLPFMTGDPIHALQRPDGVVLSQPAARKYFGTSNPMGRTLTFDGKTTRTVTGVLRDLPYNTQFSGDLFVRYQDPPVTLPTKDKSDPTANIDPNHWTQFDTSAYVRLAPNVAPQDVAARIPDLFFRHMSPQMLAATVTPLHIPMDKFLSAKLIPLRDVHLAEHVSGGGMKATNSRITVYGLAVIALLVLMIAGINFTNLATARATLRAKEVSLRKTVGANRKQLIVQFLTEAVLTALLALLIALVAVEMLLPAFSHFLGHPITLDYLENWPFVAGLIATAITVGLLGGIYPALILSKFRPADILHPTTSQTGSNGLLRTLLAVLQFSVSIGLGISALVIFAQIQFARHIDLGFDRNNVVALSIYNSGLPQGALASMAQAMAESPNITGVAMSNKVPGDSSFSMAIVKAPAGSARISVQHINVTPEFFTVYGTRLAAGRFLSRHRGADIHYPNSNTDTGNGFLANNKSILIDSAAARALGYTPEAAVGKTVELMGIRVVIVGVVHNILYSGAKSVQIAPTVYYYNPGLMGTMSLRLKADRIPEALADIDATWHRYVPDKQAIRWFVDDSMNQLYADSERQGTLMDVFVVVAIFIASLGLFGLAAFTVARRTKEIGVRKIFGANVPTIVHLLLRQFSIPVLVANLIAWPIAWYYLHRWLESFAYHIALSPWYFFGVGAAALLIAWTTVIVHALQVARQNPVTALKYE